MNKNKGFTIIELIVVIAIISVLAAIVLSNTTQYINAAKDVAIKGEMNQLSILATGFYEQYGFYDDGKVDNIDLSTAADNSGIQTYVGSYSVPPEGVTGSNIRIIIDGQHYCAWVYLSNGDTWCTDYKGYIGFGVKASSGVVGSCECPGGTPGPDCYLCIH